LHFISEPKSRIRRYNSPRTHRQFLRRLHQMVPAQCHPIIVTDAGFRGPWFRDVEAFGWDWIGRVRNSIKVFQPETQRWCDIRTLYREATPKIRHIGLRCLSPRHRYWFRLYLVRAYQRRPGRPRKRKLYSSNDGLYRRLHRAPWLLATSLPNHRGAGILIKHAYTRRLQIEETFRDIKSHRRGFALRYAQTRNPKRLEVLLLIAVLATLILWLLGLATKARQWKRHFQANTERRRSVLSTVFLGRELLGNHRLKLEPGVLKHSIQWLQSLVETHGAFESIRGDPRERLVRRHFDMVSIQRLLAIHCGQNQIQWHSNLHTFLKAISRKTTRSLTLEGHRVPDLGVCISYTISAVFRKNVGFVYTLG